MKNIETIYTNAGQLNKEETAGFEMINPPIYNGSTVLFENYESLCKVHRGEYKGLYYGTEGTPTQLLFESAMAEIEGAYKTQALTSGISAIIAVLLAYTKSGDHILVADNVYGPTRDYCTKVLPKFGVTTTFVPGDVGLNITDLIQPNTRLVFLESPGSNTFEIQDIPTITNIAREHQIISVLDNTWSTPLYLDAFKLGVDITIHSITKYISGHSDLLMGTVSVNEKYAEPFAEYVRIAELSASQNDCYLALRGLRTLPVRLKHHEQAALEIAQWIETIDMVDQVMHPALPSHPQHHIWKRDFKGSTGLFGFTLKKELTESQMATFVNQLQLFGIGYSWGGYKSLITVGHYPRNHYTSHQNRSIIRLYIGMETVSDIKDDLKNAFDSIQPFF